MENKAITSKGAYSIPSAKQVREVARHIGYDTKSSSGQVSSKGSASKAK